MMYGVNFFLYKGLELVSSCEKCKTPEERREEYLRDVLCDAE